MKFYPSRTITGKFKWQEFITVGDKGYICTKIKNVYKVQQVGTRIWSAITYGNGRYVAVGANGYVTHSDDGVNWSEPKKINSILSFCGGIVYAVDKFIVCGTKVGSGYGGCIAYSSDGINWSTAEQNSVNYWKGITYGDGKFVVCGYGDSGYVAYSEDGVNWSTPTRLNKGIKKIDWDAIAYGNEMFIVVGNGGFISYSNDGVTFNSPITVGSDIWECCTYGGDKFVAMGRSGYTSYSSDGIKWSNPKGVGGAGCWWRGIAYANGKFVGVSYNGWITYSSDGINWGEEKRITGESGKEITEDLYGICAVH